MKVTRRDFMRTAGGFVSASALANSIPALAEAEAKGMNILFLMTDQHNHSVLGCAGNPLVKTPNLDKLASQSARFTQAVCATPFCSPTRASFLTGLWPHTHGIVKNVDGANLGLDDKTIATEQILFDKSYYTAQLGKWHLGEISALRCYKNEDSGQLKDEYRDYLSTVPRDKWPKPKGGEAKVGDLAMLPEMVAVRDKDVAAKGGPEETTRVGRQLVPAEHTYESWLTNRCIELIKKHKNERFMITWSVSPPHAPWIAPEPFYSMYDPAQMPLPKSWESCPQVYAKSRAKQMGDNMGEKLVREQMRCYYAQVTMIDSYVGRILKTLKEQGLDENTLVVYTSDHGDMQAAHGMVGKSVNGYFDEIVRVPLMIRYPGKIKPGTVVKGHANSVDIMPTLLDYAGISAPKSIQGKSLRALIEGKVKDGDRLGFCERGIRGEYGRMVRSSDWKYCVYADGRQELFEMNKDPDEMHNLAADPGQKAALDKMRGFLTEHMRETADPALAQLIAK